MKKSAIAFMLLITGSSANTVFAAEDNLALPDYNAIKSALVSGYNLSVITDFSKCKGQYPTSTIGGTRIENFLVISDQKTKSEYIAFSDYHQRLKDSDATPQVEFIRYKITADNNVTVDISRYPSSAPKKPASPSGYTCQINTGTMFYLTDSNRLQRQTK